MTEKGDFEVKKLKKGLIAFLCMLVTIVSAAAYLPAAQETVEAKSNWDYGLYGPWGGFGLESTDLSQCTSFLVVEKGCDYVNLQDIVRGFRYNNVTYEYEEYRFSDFSGAKYESKNTDILTVDAKTGKINAKKTGTALVKVTWKKQVLYGAVKVISSKDMAKYQDKSINKKMDSYSAKIIQAYNKKLNTKNAVAVLKEYDKLQEVEGYGFTYYDYNEKTGEERIVVFSSDSYKAGVIADKAIFYLQDRSPFVTKGSYAFKISKLSGSGKTVTATLSKAVTADQMAGAQYECSWSKPEQVGKKSMSFDVYLMDTKTKEFIAATVTIKTGSKKMTIQCDSSLTKGRKYELMEFDFTGFSDDEMSRSDWLHNGTSTFTAK
jgi:hypothetical protein